MVHHVISFPKDTIHLDVHALGQHLHWPEGCTYSLQESFSPCPLPIGESLKILWVTKGSNLIDFVHAEAHYHLLDVGDSVLSFFFVFFFFYTTYYLAFRLESWLRSRWESLFGMGRTSTHYVPRLLAIEALAFFGKSVSFLGCQLLELGANGIGLYFCGIYIYRNILWFPFLTQGY